MVLEPGATIWLPCEVKPGPFTNERLARIDLPSGTWVGFVTVDHLREPIEAGHTAVLAMVTEVEGDHFRATIPGHGLASNAVYGDIDKVVAGGTV